MAIVSGRIVFDILQYYTWESFGLRMMWMANEVSMVWLSWEVLMLVWYEALSLLLLQQPPQPGLASFPLLFAFSQWNIFTHFDSFEL